MPEVCYNSPSSGHSLARSFGKGLSVVTTCPLLALPFGKGPGVYFYLGEEFISAHPSQSFPLGWVRVLLLLAFPWMLTKGRAMLLLAKGRGRGSLLLSLHWPYPSLLTIPWSYRSDKSRGALLPTISSPILLGGSESGYNPFFLIFKTNLR